MRYVLTGKSSGVFHTVVPKNNNHCITIPELQACEDGFVHNGLAYLACSSITARLNWTPATLHLNATALSTAASSDYIATFNFETKEIVKLDLIGAPLEGIYVHAIELFESPDGLMTIFLNSHKPFPNRANSLVDGADSVIEVFETRSGESTLTHVKTIRDELIRTPNNIAAFSATSFYTSNDHKRKTHWSRAVEVLYAEKSEIVHCDISGQTPKCIVAADGIAFPNGLARSGDNIVYAASTLEGDVRKFEIQSDNTLALIEQYKVPRPIDNIVVNSEGDILIATIPNVLDFIASTSAGGEDKKSAVEIWKISDETSDQKFYGGAKKIEIIFADGGELASGATVAMQYKNKLLISGLAAKHVTVCDI